MNFATLAAFPPSKLVHVVVESPRGSAVKLNYDARELEAFFVASTAFENKELEFLGWSGPAAAERLGRASLTSEE